MKPMRLLAAILLCAAVPTGPPPALAQEPDLEARLQQFEQRVAESRERMNLNDEQIEEITPILTAHFEAMERVLADNGIDLENRSGRTKRLGLLGARRVGKQLDKVRAETLGKLEGVLDPKQLSEYKKIQAERKKELRKRIMERR